MRTHKIVAQCVHVLLCNKQCNNCHEQSLKRRSSRGLGAPLDFERPIRGKSPHHQANNRHLRGINYQISQANPNHPADPACGRAAGDAQEGQCPRSPTSGCKADHHAGHHWKDLAHGLLLLSVIRCYAETRVVSAFVFIFMIVTLVKATGVDALHATALVEVALLATSLAAIVTTFLAPAVAPARVSRDVKSFHGCNRVVARDDQLATPRTLFGSLIPNQDTQARAGV